MNTDVGGRQLIFKNTKVQCYFCSRSSIVVTVVILYFTYWNFFMKVRHAEDLNVSSTKASLLIGYLSIASTFGRLLFGKIADFPGLNKFHIYQVTHAFPSASSSKVLS